MTHVSKDLLEYLTRPEAAAYLRSLGCPVSEATLAVWACRKRYGLPIVKVGRKVRYAKSDLDQWLQNRRIDDAEKLPV